MKKEVMALAKYNRTIWGCYSCLFMQAFCANCLAILFVALKTLYGLSFTELGALVLINFVVQIITDMIIPAPVDKFGFKPFLMSAPILVMVGTIIFVTAPFILSQPYPLFVLGIIIYSIAAGLLEVIVSPIIDNLPTTNKVKAMSRLHGYYGVGQIFTVVVTSVLIFLLGIEKWQIVMSVFLIFPVITLIFFAKAPVVDSKDINKNLPFKAFLTKPPFILCLLAIASGAMCEIMMAQWASSFFEVTLGFSKIWGDILAVCSFALFFTIGRLGYSKFSHKISLSTACIGGSVLSAICYGLMCFQSNIVVSIIACALCGLGVCMMWPGALSIATQLYSNASTKLFGTLSCAGDCGAAIGPFLIGIMADSFGLQLGMIIGVISSILTLICHICLKYCIKKNNMV